MIGSTISHYKILEKLGGGGMGVVYKAQDTRLDRTVALKFPPELTLDPDAKERFIHEAKAASSLQHHNICTIHDIDQAPDGQMFIVMDLYEGETLKKKIEHGPLKINEATDIAIQIAQGLEEAHRHQIIHRDIKPANILITAKGVVKIVDFGLAKLAGRTVLTKSGSTVGTAAYMSPEQARGEEVDSRSDIWSLGVVLYEMIAGRVPFKGDYDNAIVYSIVNIQPDPPTALRSDVPMGLERIINKCLEKNKADRYQHVDDILADFHRARITPGLHSSKPKSLFRQVIVVAAICIVLAGALYLWKTNGSREEAPSGRSGLPKIAILYLDNLGGKKEEAFFADGMTEDIITEVSNVRGLLVLSRHDVMQFRGKEASIRDIRERLGVDYVMEGSVRRDGDKLRVTVQLINADDGFHTWAHKYDGELRDVFKVQADIAAAVARSLRVTLTPEERNIIESAPTSDLSAYEFYLKGRELLAERSNVGNAAAEQMFHKALELDKSYVLALCGLAQTYVQRIDWGMDLNRKWLAAAKPLLDQALQIDSTNAEVHISISYYCRVDRQIDLAIAASRKAVALRPNDHRMHYGLAISYMYADDLSHAQVEFNRTLDLRASFAEPHRLLMRIALALGKPQQVMDQARTAMELAPGAPHIMQNVGLCYLQLGHFAEADSLLRVAVKLNPQFIFDLGALELFERKIPEAIEHLEAATKVSALRPWAFLYLGWAYRLGSKTAKADENFRTALPLMENAASEDLRTAYPHYRVLLLKCLLKRINDPMAELQKLSRIQSTGMMETERAYCRAQVHMACGKIDSAIGILQDLVQSKVYSPRYIASDPSLYDLRNDTRFVSLLKTAK